MLSTTIPSIGPNIDESELAEYFMVHMRPLAIRLAHQSSFYDADDFLAIALEQVLLMARKTGKDDRSYLYAVGRQAMLYARYQRLSHEDSKTVSLDAYMYDDRTGQRREVADIPVLATSPANEKRQMLYKLLATIPLKHRMILCAAYGVEDEHGGLWTKENVCECFGLSRSQFSDTKWRAEAMLWRNSQKLGVLV